MLEEYHDKSTVALSIGNYNDVHMDLELRVVNLKGIEYKTTKTLC